jgi:hypothetical protein
MPLILQSSQDPNLNPIDSPKGSPAGSPKGTPKGSPIGSPAGSQGGSPEGSRSSSPRMIYLVPDDSNVSLRKREEVFKNHGYVPL